MAHTRTIPLFPLGTVLYPTAVLPLHIFEERYRALISDLTEQPTERREFGIVAIREGHEVGEDAATALYDVGTIAAMRGIDPLPDGRFDIVTLGTQRFRLLEVHHGAPYLTATVELLDPPREFFTAGEPMDDETAGLRHDIRTLAERYHERVHVPAAPAVEADDPLMLTWEIADGIILDLDERQRLLASDSLVARMRLLRSLLRRECTLLDELPSLPAADMSGNRFSIN